jgi:hypothetical protein
MKAIRLFAAAAVLTLSTASQAATVFSNNFNSENGGNTALNYNGFSNFTVSTGTVDLVRTGDFGLICAGGAGACVDLDGSSNQAGTMTSTGMLSLAAGNYVLSFALSGNQRGGAADQVTVSLGSLYSETFTLLPTDPFTTFTRAITVGSATTAALSFAASGGDNIGALLDNVSLEAPATAVPEPAPLAVMGLGLAALGMMNRRKRRQK